MQYRLIIGGVDFTPYIKEGGVQQSDVLRNQRRVIALDGTLHMSAVSKRRLIVQLMEMRHEVMMDLFDLLSGLVVVEYMDYQDWYVAKNFYAVSKSAGIRTVVGGNTYWRNAVFTLEEV